ncbi:ABC transporter ATP-binding protein [Sulfitobacter sp. D35]|uniref:ABC transporter ATP-binding protein n=1 Tax=Sulfitobacter sp. D35 TaxID=3083252 RepID=UPI00296E982D|nr:ABC transporter ATP-binding protein [Sulfitobacter sp. D35]MDW4500335.1 ABC transporter ATP-binding protein [Sulfitobacter sp. D35]
MTALLEVTGLSAGYGGVPVIEEIDLAVAEREIAVILGPNGAGKSTLLKTVFALTSRLEGTVRFNGRDIAGLKTSELVPAGISCVPQTRNVFATLTVAENLDIGTYASPPQDKRALRDRVLSLFPDLAAKLNQPAGELSGGQRQMVAMGRALMSAPKLLLLDEPTAGLSPAYLEKIFDLLLDIRDSGVTILMVEQNARQALHIADTGHVLVSGRNYVSDTGRVLLANDDVRRSFLGGRAA